EVERLVQRLRCIRSEERLVERGLQLVRNERCEVLERRVATQELACPHGQQLVCAPAPEKREQRLPPGCGLEVGAAALKDERTELSEIELAPLPRSEAGGGDELLALPPLDPRRAGSEACHRQDAGQPGAEIGRGCELEGELVAERQARR